MLVSRYESRATHVSGYTPGPYFFGSRATTLDALVYGHLLTMRTAMLGSEWVGKFAMPQLEPFFAAFAKEFYDDTRVDGVAAGLKRGVRGVANVLDAAQAGVDKLCREIVEDKLRRDRNSRTEELRDRPQLDAAVVRELELPIGKLMMSGPPSSLPGSSSSATASGADATYYALPFEVVQWDARIVAVPMEETPIPEQGRLRHVFPTRFGFGLSQDALFRSRLESTASIYSPFVEPLALFSILAVSVLLLTTSMKTAKP